jgi:hypothetical protein
MPYNVKGKHKRRTWEYRFLFDENALIKYDAWWLKLLMDATVIISYIPLREMSMVNIMTVFNIRFM